MNEKVLTTTSIDTKLGKMIIIADDQFLYLVKFVECRGLEQEIDRLLSKLQAVLVHGINDTIRLITQELDLYFLGKLKEFTTPIFLGGTLFQQSVWKELQKISYGHTKSYLEQAQTLGKPTACRAVANANGANQFAIIIPCHRIITSSGLLGGYAGGIARKQWLLDHEQKIVLL